MATLYKIATEAGPKLFYTPKQVCEMLGFSMATFWRRVEDGKIRTFKDCGRTLIASTDVADYALNLMAQHKKPDPQLDKAA